MIDASGRDARCAPREVVGRQSHRNLVPKDDADEERIFPKARSFVWAISTRTPFGRTSLITFALDLVVFRHVSQESRPALVERPADTASAGFACQTNTAENR